jgi:hypothetical protein
MSDSDVLKDAFANALLRTPYDPFGAALSIFGNDTMKALQVSKEWTHDFYVLAKQAELLEQYGEDEFLPSKTVLARRIFELAETSRDAKDRLAAYRLYGELQGHIKKDGGTNVQFNNVTNNRVMVIKDHGNDDDWERKAQKHQTKLIEHARD